MPNEFDSHLEDTGSPEDEFDIPVPTSREIEATDYVNNFEDLDAHAKKEQKVTLPYLRRAFAFKLFRLIKTWLAGAVIFLILVTGINSVISTLLSISVFIGLCGTLLYDKKMESKLPNYTDKTILEKLEENSVFTEGTQKSSKSIIVDEVINSTKTNFWAYFFIFLSCTVFIYSLLLFLPCLSFDFLCFNTVEKYTILPKARFIQASETVVIALITTTTASVIGLFVIAANWLFKKSSEIE